MNTTPKFSIVVPLHNKEKYLAVCLQGIQHQTEQNWECIIVDDGSTDDSQKVAQQFAKKDPRFKVFSQRNAGPSVARNRGIKESTGSLLHFLDADDFYPNDAVLKRIGDIYKEEHPTAISGNIGILKQENESIDYDLGVNSDEKKYQTFADLQNDYFFTRFFFDRKFIVDNKIVFPEYTYVGEDPVFLVKALSVMDKFLVTNIPVYVYNVVPGSANEISRYTNEKLTSYMNTQIEILEICQKNGYRVLKKAILDRIDRDMLELYIEKGKSHKKVNTNLNKIMKFIDLELYLERVRKTRERDGHIRNLENIITDLKVEIERLRRPGIKSAATLLAGSVKRKVKSTQSTKRKDP